MSKNTNLNKAKNAKNDEFYTNLNDIENELKHYKGQFKGKVVLLPCDDIELLEGKGIEIEGRPLRDEEKMSQFWVYFHKNFNFLGIKKLIATAYNETKVMHKVVYEGGDGLSNGTDNDVTIYKKEPLKTNGDFRSPEIKELFAEADIIVTNPPFSLFREFIAQLMEMKKQFLIVGSKNSVTYRDVFGHIKDGDIRLGYNSVKQFIKPDGSIQKFGNIGWFTNLETSYKNDNIILVKEHNTTDYPKYDEYDAINVNKVVDIPKDYNGVMGVPITFLDKYNPKQFEIIGLDKIDGIPSAKVNGKNIYRRLMIKKIK